MFTAAVLDHTLNPRNTGPLENATHYGQSGDPGGGPYVQMWFLVEGADPLADELAQPTPISLDSKILASSYATYGCPASIACASLATELVTGRTVRQALSIEANDLTVVLGGLPEVRQHCPAMVVATIHRAFNTQVIR